MINLGGNILRGRRDFADKNCCRLYFWLERLSLLDVAGLVILVGGLYFMIVAFIGYFLYSSSDLYIRRQATL